MKKLTCLFALGFLLFNNTLRANEPEKVTSTEEVSETAAKKERIKQMTTTKSSVSVDTERW